MNGKRRTSLVRRFFCLCNIPQKRYYLGNFHLAIAKHALMCYNHNMKKVKITVMRMARYDDLIAKYENPIEHACDMQVGLTFLSVYGKRPPNMCDSAWESMSAFVKTLAEGGGDFYDGWMKNKHSAMISCNDGFRPVSFYLEAVDGE
jgi:uncharacterized repeat protein (TIGR04076 family)